MQNIVIGGFSGHRKVSILSRRYVSTARMRKDGTIDSKVALRPSLSRLAETFPLLPKTVRILLRLYSSLGYGGRIVMVVVLLMQVLPSIVTPLTNNARSSVVQALAGGAVSLLLAAIVMLLFSLVIGPWHGAEHKAIAAYDKHRSTDINVIAEQERVHVQCGGRFVIPLLLLQVTATGIAQVHGLHVFLANFLAIEAVLWMDALWGLGTLPVTGRLSRLLQMHLTTAEPGEDELRTAKQAMDELLKQHQEDGQIAVGGRIRDMG